MHRSPPLFMKIDNNTHLSRLLGGSNKMMALNALFTPIRAVHFLMAHSGLSILQELCKYHKYILL